MQGAWCSSGVCSDHPAGAGDGAIRQSRRDGYQGRTSYVDTALQRARYRGDLQPLRPELRYDYRGHPERGFEDICGLLRRSLADRTKHYSYSLQIREIIVSGDLAVVRLVWTLKVIPVGSTDATISEEPGMDIFRQQPDGNWKIVRYIAYEN